MNERGAASPGPCVALYRGRERVEALRPAVERAMEGLDWAAYREVLVKPNVTVSAVPWAVTHADALETVLRAVRERYRGALVVAEGCGGEPSLPAMRALGYERVAARYGATLVDLNADQAVPVTIYDARRRPLEVRLARRAVQSDCRISLTVPKTHDAALVTLGIKNMIMGSLINRQVAGARPAWRDRVARALHRHGNGWGSDKRAMHQGSTMINLNLALLAGRVWPRLVILDGFVAMEGNGPVSGAPVPWGVAIASADALAADALAAELMGFPPAQVGYLAYCARLGLGCARRDALQIVGNAAPEAVARAFRPHATHERQRRWRREGLEELLAGAGRPSTSDHAREDSPSVEGG